MKTQEILLASALIALVGGAGAALATRAFFADRSSAGRIEAVQAGARPATEASPAAAAATGELADLRRAQVELLQRVAELETRLVEVASTRSAATREPQPAVEGEATAALARETGRSLEALPEFAASVEQVLTQIQAKEEAEREKVRKELQAQRIEDRVARMQQELGLTNAQASGLRTALIAQDDKREALFISMRDGLGDPGTMRDGMRTLRDETHAELQRIFTPEQYATFQASEESDFGRRGFGDFGLPGFRRREGGERGGDGGGGRPQ
jgi:hypothetical protein